jgi:hypothetical protein
MKQILNPTLNDLKLECVLVQAWKKASKYIRQHNWYADTLELDYQSLRLPDFIREIQNRLEKSTEWKPTPLRVVPAPKSQKWTLKNGKWNPVEPIDKKLRPLAHTSLVDQVVATAVMLCMADHVETLQGNTTLPITKVDNRRKIISYGNRLFCDNSGDILHHRWGSSKLYRQYFTDYQTFLSRPNIVVNELDELRKNTLVGMEFAIVQSDLSKFYDRVQPEVLAEKIRQYFAALSDEHWFEFIERFFNWGWYDHKWARKYSMANDIDGFGRIALPQGLVASGFFANLVLLDFDRALLGFIGKAISQHSEIILQDACRYVDDMRFVLTIPTNIEEAQIQSAVTTWLKDLLDINAKGLLVEKSKTKVTVIGRERQSLVPQSKAAARIQNDVSGTFDMLHGTELIGAIEGFFHTQQRYSQSENEKSDRAGFFIGRSDIRDDTATRFAAGRFRRVFRSLRPILDDEEYISSTLSDEDADNDDNVYTSPKLVLSKQQLDERGQLFAKMLIEEWVMNPSNIRLLRIALDMYPNEGVLDKILDLLRDGWQSGGCNSHRKEVKQYCLAEIFRAGATETGMVPDNDCLPEGVNIDDYHKRLIMEAKKILQAFSSKGSSGNRISWYLMQQVYLYIAVRNEIKDIELPLRRSNASLSRYQNFIGFLNGEHNFNIEQRCIFCILSISAFGNEKILSQQKLSKKFIQTLFFAAPSLAIKYWVTARENASPSHLSAAKQLGLVIESQDVTEGTLPEVAKALPNPFWEEENLLQLAKAVIKYLSKNDLQSPWQITCQVEYPAEVTEYSIAKLKSKSIKIENHPTISSEMFLVPDWGNEEDKKRYKLGLILRFALRGNIDFFCNRAVGNKFHSIRYSIPMSHWEQFRYGGYHGRTAFAPDWIPISSWLEDLLFQLLRWPGCTSKKAPISLDEIGYMVDDRLQELKGLRGKASGLLFLEQTAPPPYKTLKKDWHRPIRIGVIQSVIPSLSDFENANNPELSEPNFRKKHRQHFVTMIEGIEQMLRVRETHIENDRSDRRLLDLLIFPELSVHPSDLDPILVPFVRRHRCIVLAGLVFHKDDVLPNAPLVNSAIWLIPEWSKERGLQIKRIQQGKYYLTKQEMKMNPVPVSFRPAQWIINYEWKQDCQPVRITASICYDSTDLSLASDLKSRSDIFLVCALNRDVGTFDRMAENLHYHMYQGVIVVNNGQFGGSNFYMPFSGDYHRQVLHLHGQPQAQIAFIEVDPEKIICKGGVYRVCENDCKREECRKRPAGNWKTPPADWK